MRRLIWVVALAAMPLMALKLDAARWVTLVTALPLLGFLLLDDDEHPDENLLGEGFERFRRPLIVVMLVAGLIIGGGLLLVAQSML